MRLTVTILILLITASLMCFVRGNQDWPLPQVLPFLGGHEPSFMYDVIGGGGILLLLWWGLQRLGRNKDHLEDD